MHGFVPDSFGAGIIVPLLKVKSGNMNDLNNYRPITLIPVISKLFESIILATCQECLKVDDLQFGFRRGLGCTDAIFSLKTTINYYTERGSSVYAAALDLSKAFDSVNHFKLFSALLKAGLPVGVVTIICNWYGKLLVSVRWNNMLSNAFHVGSGVRQGSMLSPALFNVFMNLFIVKLKLSSCGCYIDNIFYGCIMYADDVTIMCPSVKGLQIMLDVCVEASNVLCLKFNHVKSHCIMFGKCYNQHIEPMLLGSQTIDWVKSVKYLGVYIVSGAKLSFDIASAKRSFYAACNSIHSHAKSLDQIVQLTLHESYCLPLLTYALAALTLSAKQLNELNMSVGTLFTD